MSPLPSNSGSIPSNVPYLDDRVLEYIREVLSSGRLSGDGEMCKRVERQIEEMFGIRHALLTTSCTHALETAAMLLNLSPGDEVITPSFTFVSAANAILHAGGKPVFCEIDERRLAIEPSDFARRITPRTRAVMPMHYAGVAASMDEILDIARAHRLVVIEDAAQGINARYKNRPLGTIGELGTYSFHDTKNLMSGEGGALVTNDEAYARRAEIIREKGTNRSNFLRGEVDKYTWVDKGSSYVLSDILAAVLKFQLDELDVIQSRRCAIYRKYMEGLRDLENKEKLKLPCIPDDCESNYHIFHILVRSENERNGLLKQLRSRGVGASFHYIPLHSAPYALSHLGTRDLALPVTDTISSTLIRLPIYPSLTDPQADFVIEALHELLR